MDDPINRVAQYGPSMEPQRPVVFSAPATFATPTEGQPRQFSGTAYGGGVVTDHPLFDRVAFDLATTTFRTPAAALFDHKRAVGVIKSAEMTNKITVTGDLFSDVNDAAKSIAEMADRGLPWQMSVRIYPGRIEEVRAGAKVTVNGQQFSGPLTVFRDNRIREVSFCELGADDTTEAEVFSVSEGGTRKSTTGAKDMDQDTISKADHQAALDKLRTDVTKEVTDKLTAEFTTKQTGLQAKIDELEGKFKAQADAARSAAVAALFKAAGLEFKAGESDKPYLGMTDEQFAAVQAAMTGKKKPLGANLQNEDATDGQDASVNMSAEDLTTRAQAYIDEQAAKGKHVTASDAVRHVKASATAAA